jgi:hypothetical protein
VDYKDQTFENTTVELDGNSFENCDFDNVVFHFSGGDLNMENCNINRFSFQFGGQLANGLYALYQLFGTEGMLQILRGFTDPGEGGEIELQLPN